MQVKWKLEQGDATGIRKDDTTASCQGDGGNVYVGQMNTIPKTFVGVRSKLITCQMTYLNHRSHMTNPRTDEPTSVSSREMERERELGCRRTGGNQNTSGVPMGDESARHWVIRWCGTRQNTHTNA